MVEYLQPAIGDDPFEAMRYRLEKDGFAVVTLANKTAFDNTTTQVLTIDGRTDIVSSFPVPPDSFVTCTVVGAVFLGDKDGTTDSGVGVNFTVAGFRIGTGNVADVEGVNTALEINELAIEMNTTDAATVNTVTITATADTTNQGIDITIQNDADTEDGFFIGRATIVCAKRGGYPGSYYVTD